MSQVDELAPQYPRSANVAAKTVGRRSIDWAVLVVTLALGATLAWVYLMFRAVVYAFQVALS
jgi:hypothetical protein